MARRLPVYLLIDVSESMAGREIVSMGEALKSIVLTLRGNPYALETVWISVICFAGKAKTLTPLKEIVSFIQPDLFIGGGTALGTGLEHLMSQIDKDVQKGSAEQKGDWKPIVFLLTDGKPTDNPSAAISRWNSQFRKKANLVAVSIGGRADLSLLKKLTDDVIIFDDSTHDAFAKFAQWISASVSTQSQNAQAGNDGVVSLAKSDGETVREASESEYSNGSDERFAVIIGKCSTNKLPYLLKYEVQLGNPKYHLVNSVKLEQTYFELTSGAGSIGTIDTSQVDTAPNCPQCPNESGMSVCVCGELTCSPAKPREVTCPWCNMSGVFTPAESALTLKRSKG